MYSKYRFSKPGDTQKNIYKDIVGIIWEREIRSTYTNYKLSEDIYFSHKLCQMKTRNLLKRKKFHLLLVIFIYQDTTKNF